MLIKKRENLLIVCAGDNSLHTDWHVHRNTFDILTIYYGNDSERKEYYKKISDLFFDAKGFKIELARNILLKHLLFENKFKFSEYETVWFPDDDLKFYQGDDHIEVLFKFAQISRADVFQPAIQNENYSQSWEATRLLPEAFAHRTNIVELMAHGFSGDFFEKVYLGAINVCEFMKSGWGLEPIWMKMGEALLVRNLRTYVFDCCPIVHTRPVGGGDSLVHKLGQFEAKYIPQIYTNRMKTLAVYKTLIDLSQDWWGEYESTSDEVEQEYHKLFENFLNDR